MSVFRAPNCDYEYNTGDSSTKRIGDVDIVEDVWPIPYNDFDIILTRFPSLRPANATVPEPRRAVCAALLDTSC